MASRLTSSKLNEVATPEAQNALVDSSPSNVVPASRKFPELRDDEYDDRLTELLNTPEWPSIKEVLRYYIGNFIFKHSETEGRWWNASIPVYEGVVRINIYRQEVLSVDFRSLRKRVRSQALGKIWVDAQLLEKALQRNPKQLEQFKVHEGHRGKNVRQKQIVFPQASGADFLKNGWLLHASRSLNLDLMQAGMLQSDFPNSHFRKLVDAIFAYQLDEAQFAEATVIERLIWLRKNQSKFSIPVKRLWKGRCAVTDIEAESILQACHIKPFSESTDIERLDEYNGICLSANIHSAFDAHLIGFAPSGEICFSDRLSREDRRRMGLDGVMKIELLDRHRPYVAHRYTRFVAANASTASSAKNSETRL